MVRSLRPLHAHAAWALLLAFVAVAMAPAPASAVRKRHHADPPKVFKKKRWPRKARASALDPGFATTWPCTATTTDQLPAGAANAPQVKVVYAYPTDVDGTANFANGYDDLIQADAKAIRDRVATESGSTKSVRFDTGGRGGATCDANPERYLDIQKVALANAKAFYNGDDAFTKVVSELGTKLAAPAAGARVNFLVYTDQIQATDASGQGDLALDDSHGLLNSSNQGDRGSGGLFALVYGTPTGSPASFNGVGDSFRREVFLHELSHNLGAVQDSAPHATGHGHCFDEDDIMCYQDAPDVTLTFPCVLGSGFAQAYDCGADDYFSPSPAAGSYLARKWNAFDSVYLCPVDTCDAALTPPTGATLATTHTNGTLSLAASVSGGPIAHHEWDVDGNGIYDVDTGAAPTLAPSWTTAGPRTVRMRASKADGSFALATLAVEPVTPTPALAVNGTFATGQTLALDASATQDPDGLITKFRFDLDGDNTYETDTGLGRTTSTSFAEPTSVSFGVEVEYPSGASFARTGIVQIAGPADGPATSTGTTTTPRTAPVVSFAAPSLSVSVVKLAKLLKRGLPLRIKCLAPCSARFALSIDAKTAKRLGLKPKRGKPVVIGRLAGTFAAGTVRPAVTLTAAGKRALKRVRKVKIALSGTVRQNNSAPLTVTKTFAFKR